MARPGRAAACWAKRRPPPRGPKLVLPLLSAAEWRRESLPLFQCIQTAAFSAWARSTRWRLSAPRSPLVTLFPLVSPHTAHRSDCAAAGRRREVLEVAFKSASAPDEPSCPTRSDPIHPRVVFELRKSDLLNTRRVLRPKMSQPSLIIVFGSAVARRPTARPATRASPQLGGTSWSTL